VLVLMLTQVLHFICCVLNPKWFELSPSTRRRLDYKPQ
jgi:hypothetical protein